MVATINTTCRKCGQPCELEGCLPCAGYPALTDLSRAATIQRIKTALAKRSGKQWSVKGGRGTGYGWIRIGVPKSRLGCTREHEYDNFTNECAKCPAYRFHDGLGGGCPGHACTDACLRWYITPEDAAELGELLGLGKPVHCQGESIPSGSDYYVEYIDRAEGRKPRTYGVQYWD